MARAVSASLLLLTLLTIIHTTTARYSESSYSSHINGPSFTAPGFTPWKHIYYNTTSTTHSKQIKWECPGSCTPPFRLNLMAFEDSEAALAANIEQDTYQKECTWTPQAYPNITSPSFFYLVIADSAGFYNYTQPFYLQAYEVPASEGHPQHKAHKQSVSPARAASIAGIVLASVAIASFLVFIITVCILKHRKRSKQAATANQTGEARRGGQLMHAQPQIGQGGEPSNRAPDQETGQASRPQMPVEYYAPVRR